MQAVVLAGGLGTRLRPLTDVIPKPMVPVLGIPYLEYQIRLLRSQGIADVLLLTAYLADSIEEYFSDGQRYGLSIRYSREPEPLGTGGALRHAMDLLEDAFLVIYGDSYLPIDYRLVLHRLRTCPPAAAVVVVYDNRNADTAVPNNIALGQDGQVVRYDKRQGAATTALSHVEAGVLALRRSVVEMVPPGHVVSLEQEVFPELIQRGALMAYETCQRFYDIGTSDRLTVFEDYLRRAHHPDALSN